MALSGNWEEICYLRYYLFTATMRSRLLGGLRMYYAFLDRIQAVFYILLNTSIVH